MSRSLITATCLALGLVGTMAPVAHAQQAAPAAAAAPATPADVTTLVGDWALNMESPMGPSTTNLTLRVDTGKVVADVSSEMIPKTAVTDITKSGAALVLKYSIDFQGQAVPIVLTLTPKGDGLTASFDFAGGMFQMDGVGTRKKAA